MSSRLFLAALGAVTFSLGSPAEARCGGVNGYCHYRYHTPTDKERIADLGSQLVAMSHKARSAQTWLAISVAANAVFLGIALAAALIAMNSRKR